MDRGRVAKAAIALETLLGANCAHAGPPFHRDDPIPVEPGHWEVFAFSIYRPATPRNLGGGHTRVFLPLWLQKSFGKWTIFGGPGYWFNRGDGNRNFWYYGAAAQRQITDSLSVGLEIFYQTADTVDGKDQTGFNIGALYD